MSTTDIMNIAQFDLARYAYKIKKKYGLTYGVSEKVFLAMYDAGEIQLSSVYENLMAATRTQLGKPTKVVSEAGQDFDFGGDFKTTVLQKDGYKRRFVIQGVYNKPGTIYCIGWNWMTEQPNFFAIPLVGDSHPKQGIKILVCPDTGARTGGWYNNNCAYDTWEEMCLAD